MVRQYRDSDIDVVMQIGLDTNIQAHHFILFDYWRTNYNKVYNVVQNLIPKSQMLSIQAGTTVVLVFDTDVEQTANLKKNLELLNRYCGKLHIVFLPQVLNLKAMMSNDKYPLIINKFII